MAGGNRRWVVLALLFAVGAPATYAQVPAVPSTPVQVQSAPADPPPVPPVPPVPSAPLFPSTTLVPPYPPIGQPTQNPPVYQPPPIPVPAPPLPPAVGIDVGPAPPVIPPGPLFLPGQPPAPPRLIDGTPFFGIELDGVLPSVNENLHANFGANNGTAVFVAPPAQSFSWTVSPLVDVGVHLPQCAGDVVLSYRFLGDEASGPAATPLGDFDVKSRLDVNIVDFDYVSVPDEFAPRWDVRWRLGARVVAAYYDTTATGTVLTQQASNNFIGTGPKGGLETRWTTPLTAFSLFARVDAAVLVGQLTQKYSATVDDDPYNPLSGNIKYNTTASVPIFSGSVGLNYTPTGATYLHFAVGYQWERSWRLGQNNSTDLDLTMNSFFLRGQFDF